MYFPYVLYDKILIKFTRLLVTQKNHIFMNANKKQHLWCFNYDKNNYDINICVTVIIQFLIHIEIV